MYVPQQTCGLTPNAQNVTRKNITTPIQLSQKKFSGNGNSECGRTAALTSVSKDKHGFIELHHAH